MATDLQKGIRGLLETPLVMSDIEEKDPKYFSDVIWANNKMSVLNLFKFESKSFDGTIKNILSEFYSWLVRNPRYFNTLTFDKYTSVYFEFKPKLIAKHVYGSTEMYYVFMMFNDIIHPSDLTRQYLEAQGLIYLNRSGLEALKDILVFKRYREANEEDVFKTYEF